MDIEWRAHKEYDHFNVGLILVVSFETLNDFIGGKRCFDWRGCKHFLNCFECY